MDDLHEEGVPVEPDPLGPAAYATQTISTEPGAPAPEAPEVDEDPAPSFDSRWRTPFEGLLYLGALQREFTWGGHTFVIRSLSTDDILRVGLLVQPYDGTSGQVKAYQAACVAAAVVTADGEALPLPIEGQSLMDVHRVRFQYVREKWFPPVIDVVYQEILVLETEVDRVLRAIEDAEGKAQG